MEDSVPDKVTYSRTSQACQRCRALKTRCLPSDQPGTCQRCHAAKKNCEWADAQRKRKTRGPSRISQVERKIDGLVARLVEDQQKGKAPTTPSAPPAVPPAPPPAHAAPSIPPSASIDAAASLPTPFSQNAQTPSLSSLTQTPLPTDSPPNETTAPSGSNRSSSPSFLHDLVKIHSFTSASHGNGDPHSSAAHAGPPTREPTVECRLFNDMVASGQADELLNQYRSMTPSFPFVPVAPDVTAAQMREDRSILLCAILAVASGKDKGVQAALEGLYRRELAERTIIRPCQTMPLLQSLLVYLGWYYFFFTPKSRQVLSLVQLAIGISFDLGFHQQATGRFIGIPRHLQAPGIKATSKRDAKRTWLGCYYVSTTLASCLEKPILMKYTDAMAETCRQLAMDCEFSSDETLLSFVTIRHIRDQVIDNFGSEDCRDLPITDSRTAMQLRYMESQLEEWKLSKPSSGSSLHALDLSYHLAQLELYSISLRPSTILPTSTTVTLPPLHLRTLISTLEAGKSFLDTLLAIPISNYPLLSASEWLRLPHVFMTLTMLLFPSEGVLKQTWDFKAAQERVRLDLVVESLCYRMSSLTNVERGQGIPGRPDFWCAMRMILDMTRGWYVRKTRDPGNESITNSGHSTSVPHHGSVDANTRSGGAAMPPSLSMSGIQPSGFATAHGPPLTPSSTTHTESSAGSFPTEILGSIEFDHLALPHGDSGFPQMPTPMIGVEFDMNQLLDLGLWASGDFPPNMFGGGGFPGQ